MEELPGGNEFWDEFNSKYSKLETTKEPTTTYQLILLDVGTNDGYRMAFSTFIPIFDFANLLSEFFNIEVDISYDANGDETLTTEGETSLKDLIRQFHPDEDDEDE